MWVNHSFNHVNRMLACFEFHLQYCVSYVDLHISLKWLMCGHGCLRGIKLYSVCVHSVTCICTCVYNK